MGIFERKIFGPKKNEEDEFEIMANVELRSFCGEAKIVIVMKPDMYGDRRGYWETLQDGDQTQNNPEKDLDNDGQIE